MTDPFEEEARRRGVSVETLRDFYRQRSESLRTTNTVARKGTPGQPPKPALTQQQPRKARPGILGYVADRFEGVLTGR